MTESPFLVFLDGRLDNFSPRESVDNPLRAAQSVLNNMEEFEHVQEGAKLKGYVLNIPTGVITRFTSRFEGWHVK